ncbi:hypothetical protein D3C80_581560 [compost metagenome]
MEENEATGIDITGGHKRRAIGKACPGALGKIRRRFGKNLAGDGNIGCARHAGEGAEGREVRQRLRLRPGHRATECTFALTQPHRHKRIIGGGRGKARSGKTDQRAAAGDPAFQRLIGFGRKATDIGHDDGGRVVFQNLRDCNGKVRGIRLDDICIGRKRPVDVIERLQKRLEIAAAFTGNQCDTATLETVIEQMGGACGGETLDAEAGEIVAQFERCGDFSRCSAGTGGEIDRAGGERAALLVERIDRQLLWGGGIEASRGDGHGFGIVGGASECDCATTFALVETNVIGGEGGKGRHRVIVSWSGDAVGDQRHGS